MAQCSSTMCSDQCIQQIRTITAAIDDSLIDMYIFVISAGAEPEPASSPARRLRSGVQLFRPVQQIPGTGY